MKEHFERKYLPEFVYGGIDGAITTLAIIAGAIGAVLSPAIILILGFANLIADGFSMGVSKYLSSQSQKDLHRTHKDARRYKIQAHQSIRNGFATFVSFVIIGFIPLFPFVLALFAPEIKPYKFMLSIVFTGIALIIVGGTKGLIVKKSITRSAIETLVIGGIAAVIAFTIGFLLRDLAAGI